MKKWIYIEAREDAAGISFRHDFVSAWTQEDAYTEGQRRRDWRANQQRAHQHPDSQGIFLNDYVVLLENYNAANTR